MAPILPGDNSVDSVSPTPDAGAILGSNSGAPQQTAPTPPVQNQTAHPSMLSAVDQKAHALGRVIQHFGHALEGKQTVYTPDPDTGTVQAQVVPRKAGGFFRDLLTGALSGMAAASEPTAHPSGAAGLARGFTGAQANQQAQQDRSRNQAQDQAAQGFVKKQRTEAETLAAATVAHDTMSSLQIGHFVPHYNDEEVSDYNKSVDTVRNVLMQNGGQESQVPGNGEKGNGPALMKALNADPTLMSGPEGFHRISSITYDTDGLQHVGHQWVDPATGKEPTDWNDRATVNLTDIPNAVWGKSVTLPGNVIQDVAPNNSSLVKDPKKEYSTTLGSVFALGLKNKQQAIDARNELYRAPQNENEANALKAEADQTNSDPNAPSDLKRRAAIKGPLAEKFLANVAAQRAADKDAGQTFLTEDKARSIISDPNVDKDSPQYKQAFTFIAGKRQDAANKKRDELNAQRAVEDGDLGAAAKNIVADNLAQIRDIASFKGGEKTRLYNMIVAEAKAAGKDPRDYSPSALAAKTKVLNDFEDGKAADNILAFNTFLGHANDALSSTAAMRGQAGSPLINRPINWLRKNATNDPTFTAFQTALVPVRKEYMNFLNNNRAEHEDDLKVMDKVLSDDSTPAQIEASLKKLGESANIRLRELGRKYSNTMKSEYPSLITPEGRQALQRMGIQSSPSQANKPTSTPTAGGFDWDQHPIVQ
jgi:hypothetical protein